MASQSPGLLESVFRGKDYPLFHDCGEEMIVAGARITPSFMTVAKK